MNPDKLFDYLEGKLDPSERDQLEDKLMSDPQLRREFEVARNIHRAGGASREREVILPSEDEASVRRSSIMTRRVVAACAVLVFVNVAIGLIVIAGKTRKKSEVSTKEAAIRKQLSDSLSAVAQNAMPVPSFTAAEIHLVAPRAEWESVAERVVTTAASFEGSATRGLPAAESMMVLVDLPSAREGAFRQALQSAPTAGATPPSTAAPDHSPTSRPNERTIVQVHIAESGR